MPFTCFSKPIKARSGLYTGPRWRALLLVGLAVVLLLPSACIQTTRPRPLTQVEIRNLQTRTFTELPLNDAMRSVAAALQDEGYTLGQISPELGVITGQKQESIEGGYSTGFQTGPMFGIFLDGDENQPQERLTVRQWDATANIQQHPGNRIVIRVSFVKKVLNNHGGVVSSDAVTDHRMYQSFFAKVEKSAFLQRHRI